MPQYLSSILDIFDNKTGMHNLVFDVNEGYIGGTTVAGTSFASGNSTWGFGKLDINVDFNPDLLNNGADLALAAVTIHEALHAALLYAFETKLINRENTTVTEEGSLYVLHKTYLRYGIVKDKFGGKHPHR